MQEELESLRKQGVYMFVDALPDGKVALRCLWVYKVKCGADGNTCHALQVKVDSEWKLPTLWY